MRVPAWILASFLAVAACTMEDEPALSSTEQSATMWQGEVKALVLLAEFAQNTPHPTLLQWADEQMEELDSFIRANSYERSWLTPTYRGPYLLSPNDCHSNGWDGYNDEKILRETALLADPTVDFSQYDVVIVLSKEQTICPSGNSGTEPGTSSFVLSIPTAEQITGGWLRTALTQTNPSLAPNYAHELGHVMGAAHVETLRCTSTNGSRATLVHSAAQGTCETSYGYGYSSEPMNGRYAHYSAVHKQLFGWLDPTEAVSTRSGVHTLTPLSTSGGLKLIEVPLLSSNRTSYTLEYRQPTGHDAASSPTGPTLSGVFMHVKTDTGSNRFTLHALDLSPFESGDIQLTELPLAAMRPGGGHYPSYVDEAQNIAIYVYSMSPTGAVVGVLPADLPPITWQGEIKTLVLIAEFDQVEPPATVLSWAQAQWAALDTFIRANSYDRAWLDLTFRGPYLLSTAGCDPDDRDANAVKILRETALLADPTVDFSQYDVVVVLNQDSGLCPSPNSGGMPGITLQYGIPTQEPILGGWLRIAFLDSTFNTVTTAFHAHELGHVMGAGHIAAQRCTKTNGSPATFVHSAAQGTCLDQQGHLVASDPMYGDGHRPSHYSAAYKQLFGWLTPSEVLSTTGGTYTLTPLSTAGGLKMLQIPLTGSTHSHYTLEYRQPTGYDAEPYPAGPTLSGVFMHVKKTYGNGPWDIDAVDLPPFETGQIQLTALPLASPRPGGGLEPSYIDPVQNLAIYVYSMSSSGAVVGVYPSTNWARSSNGGVVYAPSQWSTNHAKSMANNGTRFGAWWGGWWQLGSAANVGGGCWSPSTWMYVGFNGVKTIHQIDVIGLQDNFTASTEPYLGQTSSLYGLRHFHVQYWAPTFQWVDVPGGYITWNNQVWNRLTFAPVSTQYVRVWIECAMDNYARVVEVEAYGW